MLTPEGKVKGRYHTGYGGVTQASAFVLGAVQATQTAFMIEDALNRLLPESEPLYYELIERLDEVARELWGNVDALTVTKTGGLEMNPNAHRDRLQVYQHVQGDLCNLLQIVANPFDQRPGMGQGWGANSGINGRVTG